MHNVYPPIYQLGGSKLAQWSTLHYETATTRHGVVLDKKISF